MKYFDDICSEEMQSVFYMPPEDFDRDSDRDILAYALGATLYMPATRKNIATDIIFRKNPNIKSMVICLEDAIGDKEICIAENYLVETLCCLFSSVKNKKINYQDMPLIFVRVRTAQQMLHIAMKAKEALTVLTGFVFPKFSVHNGEAFFKALQTINQNIEKKLYGMPILETVDVIYKERRIRALCEIRDILNVYRNLVLNIRVGATDFCSLFGIRRGYDMTVYDIAVIRDCITDVLNVFTRIEEGYVVSAPVWEYFSSGDRVLKPQLRQSLFEAACGAEGLEVRKQLLHTYLDGLIREVLMDKANGFVGKTIIHPSHLLPVQALNVVSHEEYMDAISILENNNGEIGVMKSTYKNKMNEIKPHLNWAKKIITKSKIYGVYHEQQNFTSLLINKIQI